MFIIKLTYRLEFVVLLANDFVYLNNHQASDNRV